MGRDEDNFMKKFSVVQRCPKCSELSLSFRKGVLACSNCGYKENIPAVR